ncbi:MAG: ATP-dependent DNA helicase RecG [Oscillospiraceae bacterium]|nr:ATP-dependent DNA helicase RecG [Oscillospiraceae bacterium]
MNSETLDTSIRYLKGVGAAREKMFAKLGITTLRDLIGYFPRAYEDRTLFKRTNDLVIGETVCVVAMAATAPQLSHIRKGLDIVKLKAVDEVGTLELTFFNQPFIKDAIKPGEMYVFYGKIEGTLIRPAMVNPLFEKQHVHDRAQDHDVASNKITGRIMPIYALTAGLSQKSIQSAALAALEKCEEDLPDILPENIVKKHELCRAGYALKNIHFPEDMKALELSRKRLIFEEFFVLASAMKLLKDGRKEKIGRALKLPQWDQFYDALSFKPTQAQMRAIEEAAKDMGAPQAMNRLIQGDVGSGKTLIAAACCYMTWKSGCQSAFMAPTEILAKQHFQSLSALLEPMGMHVGLLVGSMTAKQKKDIYARLSLGEIDLIIGTHALVSQGVSFRELALVITDEQHRFGVGQRSMLTEKGDSPHVLIMSATPIPRTLALIIYGDLDVSIIDEMPSGRTAIETYVVSERHRKRVYQFINKLALEGRQIYIICPMVEELAKSDDGAPESGIDPEAMPVHGRKSAEQADTASSDIPLKSAVEYHKVLQDEIFPNLRIELVHGKMASKKKDAAMEAFARGEADILVATTVVEVGVDVPNAALIIVENADRFGLSQLHQLRGRVGRGVHESFCILFSGAAGDQSRARLDVMRATGDGFKIAEEDLKIRGPGDFFGSRQHGLPEMKIANLATDMLILNQAQDAAHENLRSDPELKSPENRKLRAQIAQLFEINADRLN